VCVCVGDVHVCVHHICLMCVVCGCGGGHVCVCVCVLVVYMCVRYT